MVVHGHGGMDELSLSGTNMVCILRDGTLKDLEITPEDAGLPGQRSATLREERPGTTAGSSRTSLQAREDLTVTW